MNPTNRDELARVIALRIMPISDVESYGIDPALIAAILSIIVQLLPLIKDCTNKESETPIEAAKRLASYRGPGWRVRQWRLRRLVRQELGDDAPRELVSTVADAIYDVGNYESHAKALFQGEL